MQRNPMQTSTVADNKVRAKAKLLIRPIHKLSLRSDSLFIFAAQWRNVIPNPLRVLFLTLTSLLIHLRPVPGPAPLNGIIDGADRESARPIKTGAAYCFLMRGGAAL